MDNSKKSQGPTGLALSNIAAAMEGLEIVYRASQLGPGINLSTRLTRLEISKDSYYRHSKEFKNIIGIDLSEVIDLEIDRKLHKHTHEYADLCRWYESVRQSLDHFHLPNTPDGRMIIKIGTSEYLSRSLISHIIRKFRRRPDCDEKHVNILVETGLSGNLYRRLTRERQLDLYISRNPGEVHKEFQYKPGESFLLPFRFVCPHNHPAVSIWENDPETLTLKALNKTTLVLLGPNPARFTQYDFPRELIQAAASDVRFIELGTFAELHELVACGRDDIATITVPEFMHEESLRGMTIIPIEDFQELTANRAIKPVELVILQRDPNDLKDNPTKEALLRDLAEECRLGLREFTRDRSDITQWLGPVRFFYHERTRENIEAHRNPFRGWMRNTIRWQFLRNGVVVGRHTAEEREGEFGILQEPSRVYDVLGRLIENGEIKGEYQLVWTGVSEGEEAYSASFIISPKYISLASRSQPDPDELTLGRDITGVWTGRRTTQREFNPATGVIVILMQAEKNQLSSKPGERQDKKLQSDLLKHIIDCVNMHEAAFPGFLRSGGHVAQRWYWNVADVPSERIEPANVSTQLETTSRELGRLKLQVDQLLRDLGDSKGSSDDESTNKPSRSRSGSKKGKRA